MQPFLVRNAMLLANALANLLGILAVSWARAASPFERSWAAELPLSLSIDIGAFLAALAAIWVWELPIRLVLSAPGPGAVSPRDMEMARRRCLNEPYFLAGLDMLLWIVAGLAVSSHHAFVSDAGRLAVPMLLRSLTLGLVTSTVAFFLAELVLQGVLVPRLFPAGGISRVRGVLRVRISTRILALVAAGSVVPGLVTLIILHSSALDGMSPETTLTRIRWSVTVATLVFTTAGLLLAGLVIATLSRPFSRILAVLREVAVGDFQGRVPVRSNDEIGFTSEVINEMTRGLAERERMRRGLELALEVQQSLLPVSDPDIDGFDVAGSSAYCDETGGDHFDYLPPGADPRPLIVVGDVSGHGLPSALIMTTMRAMTRMRQALPHDATSLVSDVNSMLHADMGNSGNFMTAFFLWLGPGAEVEWVRAGHDPALVFEPAADRFFELDAAGPALGIIPGHRYASSATVLPEHAVVLLGTDGIWEARNPCGEMFGKQRLREVVRANGHRNSREIVNALFAALRSFRAGEPSQDDVTLVVVRPVPRKFHTSPG